MAGRFSAEEFMKEITLWEARDGTRFNTTKECRLHECLLDEIAELEILLPATPKDDGCRFANGGGYIQHNPKQLELYRNGLLDLIEPRIQHSWVKQTREGKAHPSCLARLLDDSASPLGDAWNRLLCIDKLNREWGQPFYAENPDKGKQVKLN